MPKYFKTPFAENGDRDQIPNDSASGEVSFDTGYTSDYELPKTNLNRKAIEREKNNGLYHDITENLKFWQENGAPEIVTDDGSGSPVSYAKGFVGSLGGTTYVAASGPTATVPPSSEWQEIDFSIVNQSTIFVSSIEDLSSIDSPVDGQVAIVSGEDAGIFEYISLSGEWVGVDISGDFYPSAGDEEFVHIPAIPSLPMIDQGLDGQSVHPDVIRIDAGFGPQNFIYWMGVTPYKYGDGQTENPSIFASRDGVKWEVPEGLTNPVIPSPAGGTNYNADPELLYHDGQIWMYYLESLTSAGEVRIYLTKTSDGFSWSVPVEVLFSNTSSIRSPAVVHDGTEFIMWESPAQGVLNKRTSADGETWSAPVVCNFTGMPAGEGVWHQDVILGEDGYEILLNTSSGAAGAAPTSLLFGTSADGVSFSLTNKVIEKAYPFESDRLYRGCLLKSDTQPNEYDIWYSALSLSGAWTTAHISAFWDGQILRPLYSSGKTKMVWESFSVPSAHIGSLSVEKLIKSGSELVVNNTSTQALANLTLEKIIFDEVYQFHPAWNPGTPDTFVVPDGVTSVEVTVNIIFSANSTGSRQVSVRKNGSIAELPGAPFAICPAVSNTTTQVNATGSIKVEAGDEIAVYAYQTSGSSISINSGSWLRIETS